MSIRTHYFVLSSCFLASHLVLCIRQVGIVTVLFTLCLLTRAGLVLLSVLLPAYAELWWFVALFYGLCEVVPISAVLFALRGVARSGSKDPLPVSATVIPDERSTLVNR